MSKHLFCALLLCLTYCLTACVSEEEPIAMGEGGRLQLSLANINTTTTRATPTDLGIPSVADFRLRIVNEAGRAVYDDTFTEDEITLPTGRYDVAVSYGHDALVAIDAPYYIGTESVEIRKDVTTQADITARVGNALVSVNFGRNAEELARFERYYSDYALQVYVGNNHLDISKAYPSNSIYVQAGSHVTLKFWGKLKMEDDREVSDVLESADFPSVLNAADHALVTLSLPDPESALGVDISKVEVETVTMDETIPLSWLPVPTLTPSLQFDRYGEMVGTLLTSNEGYPGMEWKAIVTNAAGEEVRTMQGTGVLTSGYISSTAWPYLPQGTYKATYYIISEDGTASKASSREFIIPAPTGLEVTVSGYTSYSKYLEGKIDEANACDRLTIYEPAIYTNVASSLLNNSNYRNLYTFTYTYDGTTANVAEGSNSYEPGDMTEQEVRSSAHTLRGNLTFDGTSVQAEKSYIITGLPYALNLAIHEEWTESSGVDWFENDVRLGHLSTGSQYIQTTSAVCIPPSTYFNADYSVNIHTLTVGTYLSIKVGDMEIYKKEEAGTPFRDTDHPYSGTTDIFHDDANYATTIRCYNDYGAGQTCSHIYSLSLKYAARP